MDGQLNDRCRGRSRPETSKSLGRTGLDVPCGVLIGIIGHWLLG